MSTKIYTAVRLGTSPGADPFAWQRIVRGAWEEVAKQVYLERVVGRAVSIVSRSEPRGMPALWEAEVKLAGERVVDTPSECGAEIVMLRDPETDWLVAMVFARDARYFDRLVELEGVSYYGYWDNTDRDETCSDEEWEERRETWERVLGDEAPAYHGLRWSVTPEIDFRYSPMLRRDEDGFVEAVAGELERHHRPEQRRERYERALAWLQRTRPELDGQDIKAVEPSLEMISVEDLMRSPEQHTPGEQDS